MKLASYVSARYLAAGLAVSVAGVLLVGCATASGNIAEANAQGSESQSTEASQEAVTTDPERDSAACESALSAAVTLAAQGFGITSEEALDFTLSPATFPEDWAAALPAEVSRTACAMELTWGGDTGTIAAFTVTAEDLTADMDVTQLDAYQAALAEGGNMNIVPGPEALGLPVDLAAYPDQAEIEPYRIAILRLFP